MNTGLQDAANLAWKLVLALRGQAGLGGLLDSYHGARWPGGPRRPPTPPASIMPSRPTANTPARSERRPPLAASTSGVAIRIAAASNTTAMTIAVRP